MYVQFKTQIIYNVMIPETLKTDIHHVGFVYAFFNTIFIFRGLLSVKN